MKKPCLPAFVSTLLSLGFVIVSINVLNISLNNQILWKAIASSISIFIFSSAIVLNIKTILKLRCLK